MGVIQGLYILLAISCYKCWDKKPEALLKRSNKLTGEVCDPGPCTPKLRSCWRQRTKRRSAIHPRQWAEPAAEVPRVSALTERITEAVADLEACESKEVLKHSEVCRHGRRRSSNLSAFPRRASLNAH